MNIIFYHRHKDRSRRSTHISKQFFENFRCLCLFHYLCFQVRETQGRVEELETANSHLQRRLDKIKNAKSALLKEL